MELLQQVGLVIRGAAVRSPMILGPIGQKWVCAAGVERSTLHRCGLTGLGLINPFFHSSRGPWSVTFPGRDREVEVIKKRCFSSHLRSRGKVACQAGLYIYNSCLLTGCSSLSTLLRTYGFAYLTY